MAKRPNILPKNKLARYGIVFILSIILIILPFIFQEELTRFRSLGLLGIFLVNFFSTVTLFLPNFSAASVVAGGNIYNPLVVALLATLGGALGDTSSFIVGRSGKEIFIKNEGKVFQAISDAFLKKGWLVIFILALIPNPVFDAIGIFAGIVRYPFKKYFMAMLAGRIVRNILLAYLGNAL